MNTYDHKTSKTTSDFDDSLFPSRVALADDESSSNIEEAPNTADMPLADRGKFVTNSYSCPPPVNYAVRREECNRLVSERLRNLKAQANAGTLTLDQARQQVVEDWHGDCEKGKGWDGLRECMVRKCMTNNTYYMENSTSVNETLEDDNVCSMEYKLHRHVRGKQITGFDSGSCTLHLQVDGQRTKVIGDRAGGDSNYAVVEPDGKVPSEDTVFQVDECVFQTTLPPNSYNFCHVNSSVRGGEVCPVDGCRFYGGNCIPKT